MVKLTQLARFHGIDGRGIGIDVGAIMMFEERAHYISGQEVESVKITLWNSREIDVLHSFDEVCGYIAAATLWIDQDVTSSGQ